jgi:hypothetical protein
MIGSAIKKLYFSIETGTSGALINHLIKNPYDTYIMGSSQSQHGYIPSIIEDEIGQSVYNAGEDGTDILYKYAVLHLILKTHKPKLIIWEVSYTDYSYYGGSIKLLLPYYENKKVREMLNTIDPMLKIAMFSKIYPYNQKIATILTSYFGKTKNLNATNDKGYSPIYGFLEPTKVPYLKASLRQRMAHNARLNKNNPDKDIIAQQYFHKFISDCKNRGIVLIAFEAPPNPVADSTVTQSLSPQIIQELRDNDVKLHRILHTDYPQLNHLENYRDFSHLNHSGATVYSQIVAKILKKELESLNSNSYQSDYQGTSY